MPFEGTVANDVGVTESGLFLGDAAHRGFDAVILPAPWSREPGGRPLLRCLSDGAAGRAPLAFYNLPTERLYDVVAPGGAALRTRPLASTTWNCRLVGGVVEG